MSQPIPLPDPARGGAQRYPGRAAGWGAFAASLASVAGTAVLGVVAGLVWAALAPRPLLEMTGAGAAAVINPETSAYLAADAVFCVVCLAGGALSGLAGYVFAVRRWGPLPMAGVLIGAVAAAFIARWVGEQVGRGGFRQHLSSLPAGAHLHGPLTLGADSVLAFWPLAAGLVAGGLAALLTKDAPGAP